VPHGIFIILIVLSDLENSPDSGSCFLVNFFPRAPPFLTLIEGRQKKHQPTNAEILEAIGHRFSAWQGLVCFIREKVPVQKDFKFYMVKTMGGD